MLNRPDTQDENAPKYFQRTSSVLRIRGKVVFLKVRCPSHTWPQYLSSTSIHSIHLRTHFFLDNIHTCLKMKKKRSFVTKSVPTPLLDASTESRHETSWYICRRLKMVEQKTKRSSLRREMPTHQPNKHKNKKDENERGKKQGRTPIFSPLLLAPIGQVSHQPYTLFVAFFNHGTDPRPSRRVSKNPPSSRS